ncbi:DUF885 domain-containing protein [Flagellimonas nanhaiensis]|uniref:DUF885 domain-containing protein n=1 Tax=Flagellimonas nanhaiensis TaxID=2292706 RepID=A0A371JLB9_9FLAO|nr:DUF885 domain-containing protein [Allomuricauda nanhaiensis]RDY57743.1 DUF885 domain-containing protein [Allomuricauda nanhaiensis]
MKSLLRKGLVPMMFCFQFLFAQDPNFENLRADFLKGYAKLDITYINISYVQNMQAIQGAESIREQELFFRDLQNRLKHVDLKKMDEYQKLDYDILIYETALNLERLALEKKWKGSDELDDSKSVYHIENGKEWYAYLLKKWVDISISPKEMFQFGLLEIEKVKAQMKRLQQASGLSETDFYSGLDDEKFFIERASGVQAEFEKIKSNIGDIAVNLFPYINDIPEVHIARGTNPSLAHAPAYYANNTFYFNFFDEPFNRRQLGWFFAHEAIPGHHYQSSVNRVVKRTEIQDLFWYAGFVEGWGAYVEHLGDVLGVYETIYDEYGKWEWDLIRSVRVSLDVGLNYYGWSDEEAMTFWKKHITDKDDIGVREINRMKRWPAQVISYKYGAKVFLGLLENAKKDPDFDYKTFHEKLLKHGDIPISVLEKRLDKGAN